MIDHWVGEVFDALSERGLWESTAVIVCTDHGHYLGEKDIWGKPGVMQYEPLGHIPLLVHWPGVAGGTECDALDDQRRHQRHASPTCSGCRRRRVLAHGDVAGALVARERRPRCGSGPSAASTGTGCRSRTATASTPAAPSGENFPLSMWSNRWSTMPVHGLEDVVRLPPPDRRARLDFMPGTDVPVIRQPFEPGDRLPFWVGQQHGRRPLPLRPRRRPGRGREPGGLGGRGGHGGAAADALASVEAPGEQLERLGIA